MRLYKCCTRTPSLLLLLMLLLIDAKYTDGAHLSRPEALLQTRPYTSSSLSSTLWMDPGMSNGSVVTPLVEEVVMIPKEVLKRITRDSQLNDNDDKDNETPTILHVQEKMLVHENPIGQMLLAGALGSCIGLLGGVCLTLGISCCYFRCRSRGGVEYDQKCSTYRSADLIDGAV